MTIMKDSKKVTKSPVAVVGFSLRAPNCSSVPEFAQALRAGKDLTTSNTRYPSGHLGLPPRQGLLKEEDLASFDASFFGLAHKQADAMDPAIRLLLQVSYEALMDAQIDIKAMRGSKTGVYVGHCFSDYLSYFSGSSNKNKTGYELVNGAHTMASNRLSYFYDLKGPSMTIDTACSSSLVAFDRAVKDLAEGVIDRAIVGGTSLTLDPHKNASFNAFTMLSPTGRCHSFDTRADGYCRAEGIACVILERGTKGYACVAGTGTNSDGATPEGITYPSSSLQATLMKDVFADANLFPADVVYHEAHGTGTIAGDREELSALSTVYLSQELKIGSVKSNMGHAEGASGLIGLIKILLMCEDKTLFPNYDFQASPHAQIQNGSFTVVNNSQEWTPGVCTISNFGFGGSNAFAILKPTATRKTVPIAMPLKALPFATVPGDASKISKMYKKFYAVQRSIGNHSPFQYEFKNDKWQKASPLVFVCNGQGSQWNKMGQDLMQNSDVFCSTMQRLEKETNTPLVKLYEDGTKWMLKENSTIGIVSFQLGIIAMLREAGIKPDLFLGHSLGELACGFLAGVQTEAEVLRAANVRSKLVSQVDPECRLDIYNAEPYSGFDYIINSKHLYGEDSVSKHMFVKKVAQDSPVDKDVVKSFSMRGKMVVVGCEASIVNDAITHLSLKEACIACYNAPKGQTLSGPQAEIDCLLKYLAEQVPNLFVRDIPTDNIAYHAPYLSIFRNFLSNQFGVIEEQPLPSSWLSTCKTDVFGTEYLVNNICHPVHFQGAIESLPSNAIIVEIGPANGLLAQIKRTRSDLARVALVEREKPIDIDSMLGKLQAWSNASNGSPERSNEEEEERVVLHYEERYPNLWDKNYQFPVPSWEAFNLASISDKPKVTYDLTSQPFSSIRDHAIRGQNLFPAAGFVHALWSTSSFKARTEILDFRVVTPLVIAPMATMVELSIHQAGNYREVWDMSGDVCYASGRVQPVASTARPFEMPICGEKGDGVKADSFYPHIRRFGYEYGPSYQLLDDITAEKASLKATPSDWISYLDACLHLDLFDKEAFAYPVGFDRVVFWSTNLQEASPWVKRQGNNTFGNADVLLEGMRMEFVPITSRPPSLHKEIFIEYADCDLPLKPSVIAALLLRESNVYRVEEPLTSPELQLVVQSMQDFKMASKDNTSQSVVISDKLIPGASLVVTTDKETTIEPGRLVARWGNIQLVRVGDVPLLKIVTDWKMIPEEGAFVWKGDGSSGAVASLIAERDQNAISYEGDASQLLGLEKQMRHNFIRNGNQHGVWVDTKEEEEEEQSTIESPYARLHVTRPGHLDSLKWSGINPREFTVETKAATLNFRDVMRAMGQLKEEDLSLGLEFSGIELGSNQRVFGVTKHALSTHCSPIYSFPTPDNISDEEAATIPVVYLTAYYAMFKKANMKKGESILIHAGTGGVGMAAITLAQKRGLKVFTTCSAHKRTFLKEKFGLTDEQIGDSRSDNFIHTILEGTGGRGVDVVLNQLSGHLQTASLRCVASSGHFCEIGKYDIMQNTGLGQALLAANISFHVIDLLPLLRDPAYKPLWDSYLSEGFRSNEIIPLPVTAYEPDRIVDAFRFMSQGKHMGKIIIHGFGAKSLPIDQLAQAVRNETHLVTGGLGGLGLSLASRLARNGCKKLVLVGRRGVTNGFQRQQIARIESVGCKVELITSNLLELDARVAVPDRIWHVATVYEDVLFNEMSHDKWDPVVQTKVGGYERLRKLWPDVPIVAISSVVAYFGNAMQTHYASANAAIDAFARKDSNTVSVRLGALDNVGFITKADSHRALFQRIPFELMRVDDVLDRLLAISAKHRSGVFGVYDLKKATQSITAGPTTASTSGETVAYTLDQAQKLVATVLGGRPDQYSPNTSLKSAGLDSLSTMEVVHHIQEQVGSSSFKSSSITDHFTVQDIVDVINAQRPSNFAPSSNDAKEKGEEKPEDISNQQKGIQQPKKAMMPSPARLGGTVSMTVSPFDLDFTNLESALSSTDVLVLRQGHSTVFNHGAPIESRDSQAVAKFMDRYVSLADAFAKSATIVVAVIEGEVRGGGNLFPAMADVCIATPKASFGLPEIHRGMIPSVVSNALVERLGRATTRRLSLTGEAVDASSALRLGMIDNLVETQGLEQHLASMLRRWEPRVRATRFIKTELVPRKDPTLLGMGTVVGSWLNGNDQVLHNRKVLDVAMSDGVATLTMCDTDYQNTMTFEMTAALRSVIPRLRTEARCIILASSLNNFHVGLNPSRAREWASLPTCQVAAYMKECYMGFVELASLGIPIIAVLNGKVFGGGLPIALWCDYRIATSDVDMHFGNISRGMSPAGQLSRLLQEYMNPNEVMRSYLENSHWSSSDLSRLSLVANVAPTKAEALEEARKLGSYVASHPPNAVRHTLQMTKSSYAAEVANEEAWLIAEKITQHKEAFQQKDHTPFQPKISMHVQGKEAVQVPSSKPLSVPVGIVAMETYTPGYTIDARELEAQGIPAWTKNGQEAVGVWDSQEDAISIAMNAVSSLLDKHVTDPYSIGRIEVGTESNVDMAKSIKSYLMELLPSNHLDVEGVDNINACYGATAALLNTIAWCRETGRYGIVVAADTADMDLADSAWRGASAVAMLIGPDPWIEIHPERVSCMKNTFDFLKPRYSNQATPYMKTKDSMNHYMDALDYTINKMRDEKGIDPASFDAFVFHGGLCTTFMKLVERHLLQTVFPQGPWKANFELAQRFAGQMGGLYTASLYVNLMSLLHGGNVGGGLPVTRVGLFGYGSGSSATLMHATIHHERAHDINLAKKLAERKIVLFDTLSEVVRIHHAAKEGATTSTEVLDRQPGYYYRDVANSGVHRPIYAREGGKN